MSNISSELLERCDESVAGYALLDHSFYRRWTHGTLPVEALGSYACEYGSFIRMIGRGWEAAGKPEFGRVEDGHARVWDRTFSQALGAKPGEPEILQVRELLSVARELFEKKSTAIGALYAIEAQQPEVAKAKIKGLEEHYRELPASCSEYFRLHVEDYDELSLLKEELTSLTNEEREESAAACETMAKALYDALTGIEEPFLAADRAVA